MLWLPAGDITSPDVCLNRFNQGMGSNCCGRFHEANNQKTIWESRSPGARTEQEWLSSSQIIGVGWGWNLSELTHLLLGFLDRKRCNKSASYIIIRTLSMWVITYITHYNPKQTEVASPSPTHPTCNCAYKPLADCIERPSSHLEISIISLLGRFLLETFPPTQQHVFAVSEMRHIVIWTLHIYIYHEGIRHVNNEYPTYRWFSIAMVRSHVSSAVLWHEGVVPGLKHATPGHIIQLIHDS